MENISAINKSEKVRERTPGTTVTSDRISRRRNGFSPDILTLISEGGFDFFRYIKSLGMSKENNLIVLSSKHHYYYDESDLKGVSVLVNLKKLNMIKHLDLFLNSLVRLLPPDTKFVGYFSEDKADKKNIFHPERILGFISKFENFLDSRTENSMNRNDVSSILEKNGFNVVNMTSMNGHTYFYSQYSRRPSDWN
jgi:hypothetical protein